MDILEFVTQLKGLKKVLMQVCEVLQTTPEEVVARVKELVEAERVAKKVSDEFGLQVTDLPKFVVEILLPLFDKILAPFFSPGDLAHAHTQNKFALLAKVPARIGNLMAVRDAPVDETGVTFTAGKVATMLREIATKLREGMPAREVAEAVEANAAKLDQLSELLQSADDFVAGAAQIFETVAQLVKCPHCSGLNHPDAKTCEHCGRSLVAVEQLVAPGVKTVDQAAAELGIAVNTLRRWAKDFARLLSLAEVTEGSDRRFTQGDLKVLARVKELLKAGNSTEEVLARLSGEVEPTPRKEPGIPASMRAVVCPYCQAKWQEKGRNCGACGKTIDDEALDPASTPCPYCETRNLGEWLICRACGKFKAPPAPLKPAPRVFAPPPAIAPTIAPTVTPASAAPIKKTILHE